MRIFFLIGFIGLIISPTQGQHFRPSGYHGGHHNHTSTQWHDGLIVTTNGDTLGGRVRMLNERGFVYFHQFPQSRYEQPEVQTIKRKSITFVRLFAVDQNVVSSQGYTDYLRIKNKKKLYRRLSYGNVSVFDTSLFSNEKPGWMLYWGMLIIKGNDIERIRSANNKKALTEVINKFYNQGKTSKDFKSKKDAFRWLCLHAND